MVSIAAISSFSAGVGASVAGASVGGGVLVLVAIASVGVCVGSGSDAAVAVPVATGDGAGVVGVLATPATFQGRLYASVVERFASGVLVLQDTCPGLVSRIEDGEPDTPGTRATV